MEGKEKSTERKRGGGEAERAMLPPNLSTKSKNKQKLPAAVAEECIFHMSNTIYTVTLLHLSVFAAAATLITPAFPPSLTPAQPPQ